MAYLAKARKTDLFELCEEIGVVVDSSKKILEMKNLILKCATYEEDEVKIILDRIIEDRKQRDEEKIRQDERDRQERMRQEEREERMAREAQQHELEMKKLELSSARENSHQKNESDGKIELTHRIQLNQITPKYDEKHDEMGLYLINFERRAEMAQVPKKDWVAYLLAVLPAELSNMLAREEPSDANNYDFVKSIILKRYKLNSEKLKQCFYRHPKSHDKSWRNYAQELSSYFTQWISELNIETFQQLKDLIVTEQLKFRVSSEIRDHFLEDWLKFTTPYELADKLDDYESIKDSFKKKDMTKRNFPFIRNQYGNYDYKSKENAKYIKPKFLVKAETSHDKQRDKDFERRKTLHCYECGSSNHLRPQCDKLKKNQESISHIVTDKSIDELMSRYTSVGKVNGMEMKILRDTGATLDLICNKYVKPHMYTNEKVWLRTPLEETLICLPLAEVELECELGHIITKAAVLRDSLDQGRYLLGNKTAMLLEDCKNKEEVQVHMLNAIQTRAQKKISEMKNKAKNQSDDQLDEELSEKSSEVDKEKSIEKDDILPVVKDLSVQDLTKTSPKLFAEEQHKSEELKPLIAEAKKKTSKTNKYLIEKNMLFYKKRDKNGNERKLIVVPEKFREQLKIFCHEGAAAHLGVSKTKDALFKTFFWPNCFSDVENFVKTCDHCQRVGKPRDKKKAPLKIVPVISEIFTKLNVDACGPLPVSTSGNKYIITVICMSSKYPDAIPTPNLCSPTIVDALLQIFSRQGFPKELQTDQGTSFMSALTSEFLDKFGVRVVRSSVRHPQSNPVERMHRTLKRILRVLCLESGKDWEKVLPHALFALRTVTHDSTGFSPAELVHGRNLRTPMMLLYENLTEKIDEENNVISYVFDLMNRMKHSQELAVQNMQDAKVKQKLWYDLKAEKREFKENDLVLVVAPSKPNKLSINWIGPGKIVKRLSETNYVVHYTDNDKTQVYHVNMLKPYYQREDSINLLCLEQNYGKEDEEIPKFELESMDSKLSDIWQNLQSNTRLSENQIEELYEMIKKYSNIFSIEPGCTSLAEHNIELECDKPICAKPYRLSPRQNEILKAEVEKMLKLEVIRPGESDYTSPLILVEAPGKEARPCIDYRRLNKITRTKFFPLPNIEELIERVSAAKYITVLDLTRGYWQIPLSKNAQRYAAFVTNFGTFLPLRLPFGLKNAPYDFSRLMAKLLKDCETYAVPYLDDVAIYSHSWKEHLVHVENILSKLQDAQLHIKPSKCQFAQAYVKYLGHLVGQGLRTPSDFKVQAIKDFPNPTTKTHVRAFLGIAGYYRKYIPEFSVLAAPLTNLLKGKQRKSTIEWNDSCQKAFENLKDKLSKNPVLYSPDFERPFILQCDASNLGIGVVLSQMSGNDEHPILFLSKKFTSAEQKYSTTERECAAIIFAVQKLKCYLDGHHKFVIQTDHNPLVWLEKNTGTNPRLLRWALILQSFNYEIVHRTGKQHQNADSLSRIPDQ